MQSDIRNRLQQTLGTTLKETQRSGRRTYISQQRSCRFCTHRCVRGDHSWDRDGSYVSGRRQQLNLGQEQKVNPRYDLEKINRVNERGSGNNNTTPRYGAEMEDITGAEK